MAGGDTGGDLEVRVPSSSYLAKRAWICRSQLLRFWWRGSKHEGARSPKNKLCAKPGSLPSQTILRHFLKQEKTTRDHWCLNIKGTSPFAALSEKSSQETSGLL